MFSRANVPNSQIHDYAGDNDSDPKDDLVLRPAFLDQSHNGIGQSQSVHHVKHLFARGFQRPMLVAQTAQDAVAVAEQVVDLAMGVAHSLIVLQVRVQLDRSVSSRVVVGGEGSRHQRLPLPFFVFARVSFGLDVVDGGDDVFDVVLELIHLVLGVGAPMRRLLRRHRPQSLAVGVNGVQLLGNVSFYGRQLRRWRLVQTSQILLQQLNAAIRFVVQRIHCFLICKKWDDFLAVLYKTS